MADTTMTTIRSSTVASEETLFFLEVGTGASKAYHMLFVRAENSTVDTGVETEDIPDVTQATQATEIKSYKPSMTLSGVFLKEDPCYQAIEKCWRTRATGSASHFNLLEVDTWDSNKAYLQDVSISVSSLTNEAGGKRRLEATLNYVTDPTEGTAVVNLETGVATFTPTTTD